LTDIEGDIDLREVLQKVRKRYNMRLPSKVLMVDYDDKEGDLYIRFKEVKQQEGQPTKDGLAIVYYDDKNRIVALEVLNIAEL